MPGRAVTASCFHLNPLLWGEICAWRRACSRIWVAEDRSRDTESAAVTRAPALHLSPCRTRSAPQPWHSFFVTQSPPLGLDGEGRLARHWNSRGRKPTPRENLPVPRSNCSYPASETLQRRVPFCTHQPTAVAVGRTHKKLCTTRCGRRTFILISFSR